MRTALVLASLAVAAPAHAAASLDRAGRVTGMSLNGEQVAIRTDLRIPQRGWGRIPGLGDAADLKRTEENGRTTFTGRIDVAPGQPCRFEETYSEAGGIATLTFKVTADADVDTEGVFFWLDVPIDAFRGGQCELSNGGAPAGDAVMPREKPAARHFLRGTAGKLSLSDAAGRLRLELECDRPLPVVVQDTREWQGADYSAFLQLAPKLAKGESTALKVTLKLTGQPDQTPANLALDAGKVRYKLDGFGGNYCFGIESPVTQYTLKNLKVAWARTEMSLALWEPQNDNDSPDETNWPAFAARDQPGSRIHNEFLLAKQLQEKGIPYVISVWDLPEWLYSDPGVVRRQRGHVPEEKWPELLECIGSYLTYAKQHYGVEPNLFSFNEADYGVRVHLTAEEHRDAIKRIGAHLKKLGLKTKMLLGDTGGPRGSHVYALPAANDPEALQYIGAVAFHSWGGGTAKNYSDWADLAERLKLPLLVAELGTDAGAWRTAAYDSYGYAMGEVRMYQELLLHARPQGTMQWEFTADYSTVRVQKEPDGTTTLTPTVRFQFVKHFCNLTPHHSDALATSSDNPKVLFTAFAGPAGKAGRDYTLHVANLGAGRKATITGIPAGIKELRAVRTSETEAFRELPAVPVRAGAVALELAPQSLLTLTTVKE